MSESKSSKSNKSVAKSKPKRKPGQAKNPAREKKTTPSLKSGLNAAASAQAKKPVAAAGTNIPEQKVRLDTTRMKSSYCNVCNATSTREEVVLNFGLNQSWDRTDGDIQIEILHRIIMNPHAAKKLHQVLDSLIDEYEGRFGPLSG